MAQKKDSTLAPHRIPGRVQANTSESKQPKSERVRSVQADSRMPSGEDVMPEDNATSRLISELEQQAQDGDAAAACKLADHYREGDIIPQDVSLALHWYRRSAELGDPEAQNNLASMLLNGLGCERDVVQAVQWYRMRAEQGLAIAQYNLAKRYLHGEGVDQDYAKAREWFERAVLQGDAWATSELGTMY